jgi:hypothetical protein
VVFVTLLKGHCMLVWSRCLGSRTHLLGAPWSRDDLPHQVCECRPSVAEVSQYLVRSAFGTPCLALPCLWCLKRIHVLTFFRRDDHINRGGPTNQEHSTHIPSCQQPRSAQGTSIGILSHCKILSRHFDTRSGPQT